MYAQRIERDTWKGEKMEKNKVDKMSGWCSLLLATASLHANSTLRVLISYPLDQQIEQLYKLMQAIRKQKLEGNDPEYEPDKGKIIT